MNGTPRAIGPLADEVLAWVADQRAPRNDPDFPYDHDSLRRIELLALAAREASMFLSLYDIKVPTGHHCPGDCHHG